MANGTDALTLSLRSIGIENGDGVVTVSHTAVATVAAIALANAVPILVDIGRDDFCMAPESLAEILANPPCPIKAVVPVHLYGHPARMLEIMDLAEQYGVSVIEDASQAHGASLHGHHVGRFGKAGAFSLYPTREFWGVWRWRNSDYRRRRGRGGPTLPARIRLERTAGKPSARDEFPARRNSGCSFAGQAQALAGRQQTSRADSPALRRGTLEPSDRAAASSGRLQPRLPPVRCSNGAA